LGGRKGIRPVKKTELWGAGVVFCLERSADLHMAQLMPLPLTVSCFSKIQIGFTFLVSAHSGSPGRMLLLLQLVTSWTVANVVEWLAVVGLHRYAQVFRQHRVDGEALASLTSDALTVSHTHTHSPTYCNCSMLFNNKRCHNNNNNDDKQICTVP